jgi:hypothetical protein
MLLLLHCKDTIPKIGKIFPEKELRGLSPNFHIHVSVSDFYIIPTICLPILLAGKYVDRSWEFINRSQVRHMNVKMGLRTFNFFSSSKQMGFSSQCAFTA